MPTKITEYQHTCNDRSEGWAVAHERKEHQVVWRNGFWAVYAAVSTPSYVEVQFRDRLVRRCGDKILSFVTNCPWCGEELT